MEKLFDEIEELIVISQLIQRRLFRGNFESGVLARRKAKMFNLKRQKLSDLLIAVLNFMHIKQLCLRELANRVINEIEKENFENT